MFAVALQHECKRQASERKPKYGSVPSKHRASLSSSVGRGREEKPRNLGCPVAARHKESINKKKRQAAFVDDVSHSSNSTKSMSESDMDDSVPYEKQMKSFHHSLVTLSFANTKATRKHEGFLEMTDSGAGDHEEDGERRSKHEESIPLNSFFSRTDSIDTKEDDADSLPGEMRRRAHSMPQQSTSTENIFQDLASDLLRGEVCVCLQLTKSGTVVLCSVASSREEGRTNSFLPTCEEVALTP